MQRINKISTHLLVADIEDVVGKPKKEVCSSNNNNNNKSESGCDDCGPSSSLFSKIKLNQVKGEATTDSFKRPAIVTPEEYVNSLKNRKHCKIYFMGKLITNDVLTNPIIRPSIRAVEATYQLAIDEPKLGSANSNISGYACSRFLHVTQSVEDVVLQNRMQRKLGQITGTCFQRCVGMDAINALFSITFECDEKYKTKFHLNLLNFIKMAQKNNFVIGGAMTDGKGDRSKRPSQQDDLDVHLRIVERRVDGIVVSGVKTHQTGCVNSHYLIVMPGGMLVKGEESFAVSFYVDMDTEGITYVIGRQSCDLRALEEGADIDLGNAKFAGQEATVMFNKVFIPFSNVFMDGQIEFAQPLVERFTAYHRRSYICKAGLGDVLIGASGLIAEYNGAEKESHVKDKLVQMMHLNETIAGMAIASSFNSKATKAGNYLPDILLANICKHHVTSFPYEIARLSSDLAGGLLVTLPR